VNGASAPSVGEPPLAGIRVVELAAIGPAPHAVMLLADLGADVARIEREPRGELNPIPTDRDPVLRNRRVARADLADRSTRRLVHQLTDRADVLVEGLRPGAAERLGLGPDELRTTNPGLIYARLTGWGQHGPAARTAGHDINYLSVTGALHAIGRRDGRPPVPLNLIADYGGGSTFLVIGILAALVERTRSGRGQVIDAAMVDGVCSLLQPVLSWRAAGLWSDDRESNLLDGGAPYYDTYTCADGRYVAVGAIERRFYAGLLAGLGLAADDLPDRDDRAAWPALRQVFAEVFARRSRDEWTAVFQGTDACVTPVLSFAEAERFPQMRARAGRHRPDGVGEPAAAPRFSRSPAAASSWATFAGLQELLSSWPVRG